MLFHEGLQKLRTNSRSRSTYFKEWYELLDSAAAKGHEESLWIVNVLQNAEMDTSAVIEAFAKTEEPLGYYFAGELSEEGSREEFDFYKKSAEGGCSWAQVSYGELFGEDVGEGFAEWDNTVYVEWLEKAVKQNNPEAMWSLGHWFRVWEGDKEKAVSYYRTSAELGWKNSMFSLAEMLSVGEGCAKDLRQAGIWSVKGRDGAVFWKLLGVAHQALESGSMEDLDCDFNLLCYSIGWGLYWYKYGSKKWSRRHDKDHAFANRCLDYYCSCVELQQKSIFSFLLFWNRTTGGIKPPGQMIAHMVWEGREDHLVNTFEESDGEEPEMKRIKK
jgi:hypothetical protein